MPSQICAALKEQIGRVFWGNPDAVELLLVGLLAEGHVLIEDVPGTGKTTLARALARSLGLDFRRIQCTPDLLPGDITGQMVYDQRTGEFHFRPGPVLSHVVLVDEINRATPRTQSALLEAMAENQVTVDGQSHPCPQPFFVLATQNPVEMAGTFSLPEAQLDRFMLQVHIGYPTAAQEQEMVRRHSSADPLAELTPLLAAAAVTELRAAAARVAVHPAVLSYLVAVVRTTRTQAGVQLGASPRASLALLRACRALALIQGQGYVRPDHVQALAAPVLSHRLIMTQHGLVGGSAPRDLVAAVLAAVPVPAEPLEETLR